MALSSFTRNALRDIAYDSVANSSVGTQVNMQDVLNRSARMVYAEMDLKSSKRRAVLTPNVFDDVYVYTAPTDLKEYGIIDVRPQAYDSRVLDSRVKLVGPEQFDGMRGLAQE